MVLSPPDSQLRLSSGQAANSSILRHTWASSSATSSFPAPGGRTNGCVKGRRGVVTESVVNDDLSPQTLRKHSLDLQLRQREWAWVEPRCDPAPPLVDSEVWSD